MRYFTKKENKIAIDTMVNDARLEFADWLEQYGDYHYPHWNNEDTAPQAWKRLIEIFKAKIKELRSNPLPKQSVDGKESEERDGSLFN